MFSITSAWPHQDQVKVEWNLGKRCNYDCSYCPSEIHDNYSPHTDINLLLAAVDRLCEINKPLRISFTGGEPTVHPKFEQLLEHCSKRNINWINITTNGTRTAQWYIDQERYFNHLVFSLHFEFYWERIVDTILDYKQQHTRDFFVNVMAHHDKMREVKSTCDKFDKAGVKYALRRIRWTQGDHDIFDDGLYTDNDLEWLLSRDATVKPNVLIDGKDLMHSNDVIKLHLNKFKGWECRAGLESLMINWDGTVHRATCRVGGSLGNIYEGSFVIPESPIICTRESCTCSADIPLTKHSLSE